VFLVAGMWKLERLDAERRPIDLAVAQPPPSAPSGSPAAAPQAEPFKKKQRKVVKEIVIADPDREAKPIVAPNSTSVGTGGTGTGAGSGSGTDPTGTGACTQEPCGPVGEPTPAPPKVPKVETPITVPPAMLKSIRISGDTQVHPPAPVKTAIMRDGKTKVIATYRVCVGTDGNVSSTTALKPSGYDGYDAAIVHAIHDWRYRPYEVDGRKVAVCGVVTFIYSLQ
jgi:TonB family protein